MIETEINDFDILDELDQEDTDGRKDPRSLHRRTFSVSTVVLAAILYLILSGKLAALIALL